MAWFRKLLFGNFLLKLFSLILAITLYVQIHKDTLVRATAVEVKLFFDYPSDLILTSGTVTNLKITLQGPDSILKRLASKNLRYSLKLSDALPGSMQTELYTEQLRKIFPVSVRVIRVQPSLLDLTFAKLSKKKLPIKIPTKGTPLYGYRLIQGQPIPRVVTVEGPEDIIIKLKEITSETIDLRGKYRDQVMVVKLLKPDKNVRFVGPHKVKVSLNFLQRKIKKVIKDVPVQLLDFLNNKLDVTLSPNNVDVTLIGPQSQLTPLKAKELIVTVDGSKISNKPPGIHQIPLQVKPPNPELKVIKVTPSVVVLSTKARPTQTPPSPPRRAVVPEPRVGNVKLKPKRKRRKRVRRRNIKKKSKDDDDDEDDDAKKKARRRRKRRRKYRRRKKKLKKTGYRRQSKRYRRRVQRNLRRKKRQPKRLDQKLAKSPKPSGRLPAAPRPKYRPRLGRRVATKGVTKQSSHKPRREQRSAALTRPSRR